MTDDRCASASSRSSMPRCLVAAADSASPRPRACISISSGEVSWANIRDKLNVGYFDAAHMLAPAAIASSLGLGHVRVDTIAPVALGLNGNAITVSRGLHAMLGEAARGI